MKLTAFIDGASRNNPGPASAAAVIKDGRGKMLFSGGKFLGSATNNVAEAQALNLALSKAAEFNATELEIFSDSALIVNQFNGKFKIKNRALLDLLRQAWDGAKSFKRVSLSHIPRELNSEADKTANEILDNACKKNLAGEQLKLF
ncbi:MAG: ribonuclease HI family protein [Elusimicrobia bacterium]|nr:ribonuclease HI family protein [Elusimicrobiota bacterium]